VRILRQHDDAVADRFLGHQASRTASAANVGFATMSVSTTFVLAGTRLHEAKYSAADSSPRPKANAEFAIIAMRGHPCGRRS